MLVDSTQISLFGAELHSQAKVLGLLNVEHLFQRIFLDLEGYRLFARDTTKCAGFHGNSQ